jgi:hypothetical protein
VVLVKRVPPSTLAQRLAPWTPFPEGTEPGRATASPPIAFLPREVRRLCCNIPSIYSRRTKFLDFDDFDTALDDAADLRRDAVVNHAVLVRWKAAADIVDRFVPLEEVWQRPAP